MEQGKIRSITVVEIMLTYISLGWGIVLFTSPALFETGGSWEKISEIIHHEWILGLIAMVCALVKVLGIVLQHKRIRWVGLMLSTVFWVLIATSFLISSGQITVTTGFIAYSGIAVMSLWTSKEVMTNDRAE